MQDVVVIGGGPAGAAAAAHLAQAGRDVLLFERTSGPHDKVCGEFLSFEALDELRRLGLDPDRLGGVPIRTLAVQRGRRRAETRLPFDALSLSRRVLDEALLARAFELGAAVRRGARVARLERDSAGWEIRDGSGATLLARHVFLATGKHDLRGWRRSPGPQPDLIGFKMYWGGAIEGDPGGPVELHLFPGGYGGLQPVEGGRLNLCLLVRQATFSAMGNRWEALLTYLREACPGLDARLAQARPCGATPIAIAGIPYGLIQERSEGLWRLGDQAAVIPSFTGEGMSIALHSARLAACLLVAGRNPEEFQARLSGDLRRQLRRSTLASRALVSPWSQAIGGQLLSPALLQGLLSATRMKASARSSLPSVGLPRGSRA